MKKKDSQRIIKLTANIHLELISMILMYCCPICMRYAVIKPWHENLMIFK